MSKYIIFSDIHLHNYSGGVDTETRMSKRLLIQKSILQQVIDLAIQEDAILLFGGDLVHAVGNVPVEVLNVIHWFFEECKRLGVQFYAVEGNHDQVIRNNCPASHSILSPFQNREQRDKDLDLLLPTIKFIDYDQMDKAEEVKGFDVVIVHAQPDLINKHKFHMEGLNWKKLATNNNVVMFGHDHTRRELAKNCYVIGSPLQLTANDVGEDRVCYLVNSEDWKVEFIKLDYPELKRLEKIEGKEETKFEERIKATSFQDILVEWIDREQKPQSYLDLIQKDITDKIQVAKNFFNGKISSIYLKDFLSIDEVDIKLKNGFWLVMGENGSGKTTIFEGILWTLFDESTKDLAKSEVIRNRPTQQKEAIGELCLINNNQFYLIHRSSKNGLEITVDEKNVVAGMTKVQAQDFLEKHILGFDKNTYLASCYFSQEKLLTLAQLGDTDKANMITDILGFETYDSLYQLMDLKKKEVTLQLDLEEQRSVRLNNDIWKNTEQQKSLNDQIVEANKMVSMLKAEQEKVTIQIGELNTLLGNIVVPAVTTEEIDVSLSTLNSAKSQLVTKRNQLQEEGRSIQQAQNRIEKDKIKIEAERKSIEKSIANHEAVLLSLKENKCVYCGTILKKEELERHVTDEKAEIEALKGSIKDNSPELNKEMDMWYDKEAENQETMTATDAEITKIEQQIKVAQEARNTALKSLVEANAYKVNLSSQLKQLEQRKSSLDNQLQQINVDVKVSQLKKLENDVDNYDAEKLCISDKKTRLTEYLDIYTFWGVAFSSKGIRPLLLDKFVNSFNSIVKDFCYDVSGGDFIVQFTPTSKIRSGLERNKLGLEVIYKDKIVNYASLSGGEKTRASLPLCFGLNKFISTMNNTPNGLLGIMVLDEMFCYTDAKFRESVAQLLYEEGKKRSIFVIDHADTLACYTNQTWNVSKENDVTQLQVV